MSPTSHKYVQALTAQPNLTPYERVGKWFEITGEEGYVGHDAVLHKILKLESVTYNPTPNSPHESRTVFSFVVPKELCNMGGNLHGGAVALIFDITTSSAITACSKEGFWDTGHVSRSREVNCTYLRPAPEGSTVFVESWVVHLGKRMGQTMGTMRVGSIDGKVCYTCEHDKASLGSSSL